MTPEEGQEDEDEEDKKEELTARIRLSSERYSGFVCDPLASSRTIPYLSSINALVL